MTIEESFTKTLTENMKITPVLKLSNEKVVKIRVSAIIGICQRFHASGWKDSDPLALLSKFAGPFRK